MIKVKTAGCHAWPAGQSSMGAISLSGDMRRFIHSIPNRSRYGRHTPAKAKAKSRLAVHSGAGARRAGSAAESM